MNLRSVLLLAFLSCGCRTIPPVDQANTTESVVPLDVRVGVFTMADHSSLALGTACRLFAVELAETMSDPSNWGRVRVGPEQGPGSTAEVVVSGRLLEDSLKRTRVRISARDASGSEWFGQVYTDSSRTQLWQRVAADLAGAAKRIPLDERNRLPLLSSLRFASELSPQKFAGHVIEARGHWCIQRLPAEDDPLWVRAQRIRAREGMLADAVDNRYRLHARATAPLYAQFRTFAAEEQEKRDQLERGSWFHPFRMLAGGLLSGFSVLTGAAAQAGGRDNALARASERMERHGDELSVGPDRELHQIHLNLTAAAQLLKAEEEPIRLELDHTLHLLTGSAEQQYEHFREILQQMQKEEVGMP